MHSRYLSAIFPLSLGLALVACNQSENYPSAPETAMEETPEITPLNREITALKQREKNPVKVEAALREILPRYGYPVPAPDPRSTLPASDPVPGPVIDTEADALAKTSGTIIWVPSGFQTKYYPFTYNFAYRAKISVPAGESFEAYTSGVSGAEDPALVAYYQTNGEPNTTAFRIKIAAYNDDRGDGSQNARIYWKNNASSSREVHIVVHAYTTLGTGTCYLNIAPSNREKTKSPSQTFRAVPLYTNDALDPRLIVPCRGPEGSQIKLTQEADGGYGATSLAVNLETMRGGVIMEANGIPQTLNLQEVLPGNGSSFLLGFVTGLGDPLRRQPRFTASQWDIYSCPVSIGL